ncbi:MAG: hypothetical protein P8N54_01640 [Flavobacteriales bacterium]|nr:hypothetical protein [Flavobacteriales bacterium]
MKKIFLLSIISLGLSNAIKAQVVSSVPCDWMNLTVNISDTNFVDIYHPGHYLTHPQAHNVIHWEITDTQGTIIAQESVVDYQRINFEPNISLTDTLNVSAHLVNDSAIYEGNPVSCLIEDQLYWQEDLSSLDNGRWTFVHENVGVDQNVVLGIDEAIFNNKRSLVKIVDVLGKETVFKTNTVLFYIYNDGSVEKKYTSR